MGTGVQKKSLMGFKVWLSWEAGCINFKFTSGTWIFCCLTINFGFRAGKCSV